MRYETVKMLTSICKRYDVYTRQIYDIRRQRLVEQRNKELDAEFNEAMQESLPGYSMGVQVGARNKKEPDTEQEVIFFLFENDVNIDYEEDPEEDVRIMTIRPERPEGIVIKNGGVTYRYYAKHIRHDGLEYWKPVIQRKDSRAIALKELHEEFTSVRKGNQHFKRMLAAGFRRER